MYFSLSNTTLSLSLCGSSLSLSLSLPDALTSFSLSYSLRESLYFLQREVSFVNSLPVEVVSYIVGWIYCFVWSFYYYPQASVYLIVGVLSKVVFNVALYSQMILNFKRCSVSGFSLQRVFLSFTGTVAYAIFNIGLYCIPELQVHRIQSNSYSSLMYKLRYVWVTPRGKKNSRDVHCTMYLIIPSFNLYAYFFFTCHAYIYSYFTYLVVFSESLVMKSFMILIVE